MDNLISRIIATSQGGLGSSSSFIVMQIPGFWGGWGPQSPSPAEASLQPFLRPPPTSAALARWLLPCLPTHLRLFTLCLAVWCFLPLITSAGFSAAAYPGTCLLVSSSIFLTGGHPGKHCVTFPPPPGPGTFSVTLGQISFFRQLLRSQPRPFCMWMSCQSPLVVWYPSNENRQVGANI